MNELTLLHFINPDGQEYVVFTEIGDEEEYGEDGFTLEGMFDIEVSGHKLPTETPLRSHR